VDAVEVRVAFVERQGRLVATDFIDGLGGLLQLLRAAVAALEPTTPVNWLIHDLHHSTPTVVLQSADPTPAAAAVAKRVYNLGRRQMQRESVPLSDEEERALRSLVEFSPRVEMFVTVTGEPEPVSLVAAAETLTRAAPAHDTEAWGTVDGTLESVTIHQRRECSIWTTTTDRRVRVAFDETMVERIASLFGQRVRVRGRVRYRGSDPVQVDLEEIEAATEFSDAPLMSLYGRGRSWFGRTPSGELTRTLWVHDD
jgi:hypothetical protein